ncbi:Plasmepsin-1 [Clonorchis sinensis]|uniref:Plasmepsin-1 n=1 Tax=Clonorchis sinensis TaxID=79923 RepID=A0A8T1MUM0_CLOSI|nr:Plasmepsin-1 [Clonorchis sinensis]
MPPEGSTRAGILPGYPSLDRGIREAEVGFEPRTFRIRFADGETISGSYLTAVDSGSPKIWVPESVLKQINRALQPVGFDGDYYSVECSRQSHYPIIYFETGLLVLSLEPRYYIRKGVKRTGAVCQSVFVQKPTERFPDIMLGRPFLNKYFTVFDMDYEYIEFALVSMRAFPPLPQAPHLNPVVP